MLFRSCAAYAALEAVFGTEAGRAYCRRFTEEQLSRSVHIVWNTGGRMVPEEERAAYRSTRL